jgi:hypothetical protein
MQADILRLPNELLETIGLFLLEPKPLARKNRKQEFKRTSRDFYNYVVSCKRLFILYNESHIVWRQIQLPFSLEGLRWHPGTRYPPRRQLLLQSQTHCERCEETHSSIMEKFNIRICQHCLKDVTVSGFVLEALGLLSLVKGKIISEWLPSIIIWRQKEDTLYMWRDVVKFVEDTFEMSLEGSLEMKKQAEIKQGYKDNRKRHDRLHRVRRASWKREKAKYFLGLQAKYGISSNTLQSMNQCTGIDELNNDVETHFELFKFKMENRLNLLIWAGKDYGKKLLIYIYNRYQLNVDNIVPVYNQVFAEYAFENYGFSDTAGLIMEYEVINIGKYDKVPEILADFAN